MTINTMFDYDNVAFSFDILNEEIEEGIAEALALSETPISDLAKHKIDSVKAAARYFNTAALQLANGHSVDSPDIELLLAQGASAALATQLNPIQQL